MSDRGNSSGVRWGIAAALFGAAVTGIVATPARAADDTPARQAQTAPEAAEGDAGITVYIDPRTGEIRPEPAPGTQPLQLTPQERNRLSTSHQGLVEVPSRVPGGGMKLNLQGRFQSPLVGTVDADGKVQMRHLGETPRPHDQP